MVTYQKGKKKSDGPGRFNKTKSIQQDPVCDMGEILEISTVIYDSQ